MRPAILILPILIVLLGGCDAENGRLPGYVEGEYVRVAAPSGGRLQALPVQEGSARRRSLTLQPGVRSGAGRRSGRQRAAATESGATGRSG